MNFGFDYEVFDGESNDSDSKDFNVKSVFDPATEIRAIKYLCLLKEPAKILDSMVAYQALQYLIHFSNKQNESGFNSLTSDLQSLFISTFIEFLNRQLQNLDQLVDKFEKLKSYSSENKSTELYYLEMRFDYLGQFLLALNSFTSLNSQFVAKYFENSSSIKILFRYLNNKLFLARMVEYFAARKTEQYESLKKLFGLIIRIIFNLSRYFTKLNNSADNSNNRLSRKSWNDSRAFEILSFILPKIEFMPDTRILIYLTLANLFSGDESCDSLATNKQIDRSIIQNLVLLVEVLATQIENDSVLRIRLHGFRDSFEDNNSDSECSNEIACVNENGDYTLVDILNCLYNLALNDNLKFELYESFQVKKYLR
jgi:hypothetical protein